MKIKVLLALVLSLSSYSFTQTAAPVQSKPKTELEAFQEKYGTVILKAFAQTEAIRAGGVGGGTIQISVREIRSASSNLKVKGLVVEIDTAERYASTGRSFVEYGEIDSLIKGIEYISKVDKSITTLPQFEAEYRTKGDFSLTVFNGSGDRMMVSASTGSIGAKSVFLTLSQLADVVSRLKEAKTILDGLP